jgi:putative glycosyltransferase (TIGR04348 family)
MGNAGPSCVTGWRFAARERLHLGGMPAAASFRWARTQRHAPPIPFRPRAAPFVASPGHCYFRNMRIALVTPEIAGVAGGNRATSKRWAAIWRSLGHHVSRSAAAWPRADVLVALHAVKSAEAILAFHRGYPHRPIVLALTGTDLYPRLPRRGASARAFAAASRLLVLQPLALAQLSPAGRLKARVVLQSARPANQRRPPRAQTPARAQDRFDVVVAAHLRAVKDPLRAAFASRALPPRSRLRILHAGAALSPDWARRAEAEMRRNARYRWLRAQSPAATRRLIANGQLLVVSSRLEGGANVISEAAMAGTPVLASRIAGNVGLLGPDYRGYFPPGNSTALARLLWRAETDAEFRRLLRRQLRRRAPSFRPARERAAWKRLLREVAPQRPVRATRTARPAANRPDPDLNRRSTARSLAASSRR